MAITTLWQKFRNSGFALATAGFLAASAPAFAAPQVRWDALDDVGNLGRVEAVEVSPFDARKIIAGGDVLGVGLTDDGGTTWQQTLGFTNAQDNDITFHPTDPNVVWIGTLGGPYKSTDGGKTWTLKRKGMPPAGTSVITVPIERVIFDPNNVNTLLAVAGNHRHMGFGKPGITHWGGVWKSIDGGNDWTQIATIDSRATGDPEVGRGAMINDVGFAAGSSTILYACSDRLGVYKSIDGGRTWGHINKGLPNTEAWSIALHPRNPDILWVALGDGGGIYKSSDGGNSWHKSSAGMFDTTGETVFRTIAVAKSDPNYLYCSAWEGSASTYRSTDGGDSWTRLINHGDHSVLIGGTPNSTGVYFQRINVDPKNPRHVVGACEGSVVQSWNAGVTWKDLTGYAIAGGWRGTGYSGMCGNMIAWNPYRPGQVFTIGDDQGKLEHSDNYLWSWQLPISSNLIGVYNGASDVTFAADGTIYVGSGQFGNHYGAYADEPIIKSTNWGEEWFYVKRPRGAIGDNRAVYVNPRNSSEVWCITGGSSTGTLYKSVDGGGTWRALNLGNTGGLWNIAVDPENPTAMYIGATNGIYKSTDGVNFSLINGSPTSVNYEYVYLEPVDSSTVYAVSFNAGTLGGLYRFRDGRWTRLLAKPQARAVAVDPANPRRIALLTMGWASFDASGGDGIWISQDDGANWKQCNNGLRMLDGPRISFNPDKSGQLIFATNGAGYFATDLGDSTPYGGNVRSVTGLIAAGDYDDGLQGFPTSTADRGSSLSGLKAGEWAKYRVNVPSNGYYDILCRAASVNGGRFHLELNGVNVTGPVSVESTGGSQTWTNITIPRVHLAAGDQYLKFLAETDSVNMRSFQLSKL